ncbi:MAG: hypothetical protein J5764_01330, partial [Bacteroidales bacterium]|nr:hypothetical protein [Bacteroidales bacterium]
MRRLYKDRPSPALTTLEQKQTQAYPSLKTPPKDTLTVNGPDGRKIMIMRAVKDENGEMVATEELAPAIVVAPFRHVAERDGRVELRFRVCVPDTMLDSHWQLRLFPLLHLPDSTAALDPVIISGSRFRKEQLRGYQLYERFLSSIVGDNMHFVRKQDLEHFIERNSPELFALKYDSTLVSESLQVSVFGVSGAEAVEHYTNSIARMFNDRKIARKDRMFRKFVKSPWLEGTLRLDTVIRGNEKEVIFEYVQALQVRPKLKKAQISMNGGIYSSEGELW